jgi:hypothetical protein
MQEFFVGILLSSRYHIINNQLNIINPLIAVCYVQYSPISNVTTKEGHSAFELESYLAFIILCAAYKLLIQKQAVIALGLRFSQR